MSAVVTLESTASLGEILSVMERDGGSSSARGDTNASVLCCARRPTATIKRDEGLRAPAPPVKHARVSKNRRRWTQTSLARSRQQTAWSQGRHGKTLIQVHT